MDEDRHGDALEHAQAAVVLLQEELAQLELNDDYEENSPEILNKMAVLAISYHNIGAFPADQSSEDYLYEFLQRFSSALIGSACNPMFSVQEWKRNI